MNMNELNVCKEQLRACISESSLSVNSNDIVSTLTEPISLTKFTAWFASAQNIIKTKTNQHSYFKKAFMNELNKGTFEQEHIEVTIETTTLIKLMRDKGIEIMSNDTAYIEIMQLELYKAGLNAKTLNELSENIIDSMKKGQKAIDYVELIKSHPLIKSYKVDWERIQNKYVAEINKWTEMLNELNKGDFHGKDD